MSHQGGEYRDRLRWFRRTTRKDSQTGQDIEVFTANGYLWASIESITGRRARDYGADQPGGLSEIRIRQYPAVSALDRLEAVEWREVWILEDIARGDNEIIATAHRYDANMDWKPVYPVDGSGGIGGAS